MYQVVNKKDRTCSVIFGDNHPQEDTFEVWNGPAMGGGILKAICSYKSDAEQIARALNLLKEVEKVLNV